MIDQTGTHLHGFEENWNHSSSAVRKGLLPISVPVTQSMETFKEALAFVEKTFKIKGVSGIPTPPWTNKML